jgi:hypothetical protein
MVSRSSQINEFRSSWWSIRLLPNWNATESSECVSLRSQGDSGVLQISAIRKPAGQVTNDDVLEFASDSKQKGHVLKPIANVHVSGVTTEFLDQNRYWREWWLKDGTTLVYVTYNVSLASKDREMVPIEQMIGSIAINS